MSEKSTEQIAQELQRMPGIYGPTQAAIARLLSLSEENRRLREALEPFAEAAESYDPDEEDGAGAAWAHDFTIASLRRARSALSKETEGGE